VHFDLANVLGLTHMCSFDALALQLQVQRWLQAGDVQNACKKVAETADHLAAAPRVVSVMSPRRRERHYPSAKLGGLLGR
jgi:hypothetical protein